MRSISLAVAAVLTSSAALASEQPAPQITESVTFTQVDSNERAGNPNNVVTTAALTGGYLAGSVVVSGTLTRVQPTWARQAQVVISTPAGTVDAASSRVTTYTGSVDVGPTTTAIDTPFDPAGLATFEFYQKVNAGPGTDQTWDTVTLTFQSQTPPINGDFDLGTLPVDGTVVEQDGTQVPGGLDFYAIVISDVGGTGTYLDIRTSSTGANDHDTEVGLYDATGHLVATDDDSGGDWYSNLTFGLSDPLAAFPLPGSDGITLPAGAYTIVVGAANTRFRSFIGDIEPGRGFGDYHLAVAHGGVCDDADADGICDPVLTVAPYSISWPAVLSLTGARPGSRATFIVSEAPTSPSAICRPTYGVCVDLGAPRWVVGTVTVNADGRASMAVTPPAALVRGTLHFQAAWVDSATFEAESSNVVTRTRGM